MAPFFILFPQEALPEIKILFHTINNAAEIVITTLLLGYGIGALIHAPIANRFGRKSAMVAGFILSLIGITISIVSIPSHSFLLMNIGRTITGIGSGSGLVISMVMMNETHTAQRSQQLFSLVVPFFAFSPALEWR
jgi:MFS transporter, DHA1 family, multidrug resistance protein